MSCKLNFHVNLSVNDCTVFCGCDSFNYFGDFGSNPNMSFWGFTDEIIEAVSQKANKFYNIVNECVEPVDVDGCVHDAIMDVSALFNTIIEDAAKSGTWMNESQLWELETWKVINMANAVRRR